MTWKWLLWGGGGIVALVLLATLIGAFLAKGHVAVVRLRLRAAPSEVWARLSDIGTWADWNKGVKRVERRDDLDGAPVWAVHTSHGPITSRVAEATAPGPDRPGRLHTVICDDSLPFGGSWTWQVEADGGGSVVTLTEDGEVKNPLFRFLSYVVFGTTGTATAYLKALAAAFGEDAAPEVLRTR
ncbi:MAG: SRPBCC family protein [Planctomycetota bacterium]